MVIQTQQVTLMDDFPRSMGHPKQDFIAYDKEQRNYFIKKYVKISDLYMSVYRFNVIDENGFIDRSSAFIDKVFFDFDSDDSLSDVWKFHEFCSRKNILHRCHFSGRGYHGFIFVNTGIKNKQQAIGNFQRWLMKKLNLKLDVKIIGDISRIFRIPNTYNFNARRFCVGLPSEILDSKKPSEYIMRYATKQQFDNAWIGSKLLDISKWDESTIMYNDEIASNFSFNDIDPNITIDYPEFPPCIQRLMSTPVLDDETKFFFVTYLKEQVLSQVPFDASEIISICKKCWNPLEYDHYFCSGKGVLPRRHTGHRGIKFKTAMKNDYYFPKCDDFKKKGYCPRDCGRFNPAYN